MRKLFFHILLAVTFMVTSCKSGGERDFSTPLPEGWPRPNIAVSDSISVIEGLPLEVRKNLMADYFIEEIDPPGLTIVYPTIGTKIYFTFIEIHNEEQRDKILEARQKRISLNLNGAQATTIHDQQGLAALVVAQSASQTPGQLLVNLPYYVVSATAFIDNRNAYMNYDSIYPIIKVLEHDMRKALPQINFNE